MMEIIKGHKLSLTLNKIADLLYFEGPLVSLFEDNKEKAYYLYCWCEADKNCNRWLVLGITKEQIQNYIKGKVSLYKIITTAESYFLCDINNDIEYENIYFIELSQLPASYIPDKDSFFDSELDGISEEDLSVLNKRFMSDSAEIAKQTKSNVFSLYRKSIKNTIPDNVSYNQSFNKEIRNAA